ncbi:MAG: SOS response-associated peptidase [Mastigocoleus sp. MO_167.B18]|nr:SOS response-associated peptidase [Mastigocoleus sp. MO_167.B18]
MCGRFTLSATPEAIAEEFNIKNIPDFKPTYNVAPTQNVLAVLNEEKTLQHQFKKLRWGLIPSWAKDFSIAARLINARSETVAEKPAFRSPYKRRRCLVVADGFFEWKKQKDKKQPFYFELQNKHPFAFAGLWEKWNSPQGEEIKSCTILTVAANQLLQQYHHRMPLILKQQDYDLWLDPLIQTPDLLQHLLSPYPAEDMKSYKVSSLVNNPKHNTYQCIEPVA